MEKISNFINNEFLEAESNELIDNIDPSTGQVYSYISQSNANDVNNAIDAAKNSFKKWSLLKPHERAHYILKIAEGIDKNKEMLATAECIDNGKPISLAKKIDIPRSRDNLKFFAEFITKTQNNKIFNDMGSFNKAVREPLGVVATISPWNLPLYLFTWKIAPALIMGNTVVAKPSEVTPMTAFLFSKIVKESGLPPGVLNIIHGTGASAGVPLISNEEIAAVSFTGSTRTGREIAKTIAPKFKKYSLEMGGKNPSIVFDDCDYNKTLEIVKNAAFTNQGQICLCGSRILVQKGIYKKFVSDLTKLVKSYQIDDPLKESTNMGAIVSKEHFEKIIFHIELAKKEGGNFLTGGNQKILKGRCENGFFIEASLIDGLSNKSQTNQTEIFGPLATVIPFETVEEAIQIANDTNYGLAANIHTTNPNTAHYVSNNIKFGIVWINNWLVRDLRTPFGGQKESGVGREGGEYALNFFSEIKNICSYDNKFIP